MRVIILAFISFKCLAFSDLPKFKYGQKVQSSVPYSKKHDFFNCPATGLVLDFIEVGKKDCAFKFLIEFNCGEHILREWYCDRYLKETK